MKASAFRLPIIFIPKHVFSCQPACGFQDTPAQNVSSSSDNQAETPHLAFMVTWMAAGMPCQ